MERGTKVDFKSSKTKKSDPEPYRLNDPDFYIRKDPYTMRILF